MTPYVAIFLMLLLFLFISIFDKKSITIYYKLTLFTLILFGGFRYGVGVDYFSYLSIYDEINLGYTPPIELSFKLLVKLIKLMDGNFQFAFFLYQFFTIFFISKYSW